MTFHKRSPRSASAALGALASASLCLSNVQAARASDDPQVGQSFQIPYRVTLTNHYLVRVLINGKGPFNFLVDTGAPALYISTATARKVGLKTPENEYWAPIDRFDLEGGATLRGIKGRIEDPFQLEGMNALGLPGATIDGILGYTVLARYRMEFDPTRDRMNWTRLDFDPSDPFVPRDFQKMKPPPEVQMMSALGPLMKIMALFIGKQPEDRLVPQGLLGIELEAKGDDIHVAATLPDSPAAAELKPGDVLIQVGTTKIRKLADAHKALERIVPAARVKVLIRRDGEELERVLTAGEGF